MSEALVGIADRDWSRRGARSAGAVELAVHVVGVCRRERAGLVRLEAFVGEAVLPRTRPDTAERRRVLEAPGEASGLRTARTVAMSSGDVVLCTRAAGHCDPDGMPSLKDGKPGGRHKAGTKSGTTPAQPATRTRPSEGPLELGVGEAGKCQ